MLALLTLIAVGCAKEQPAGETQNAIADGRTIVVNMPEMTKTALGEASQTGVAVVWSAGDEIAVIEGKGTDAQKVSTYRLVGEGGTAAGTFEYVSGDASAEVITDIVFPASAVENGFAVPTSQTYVEGSFDTDAMVMSWTRTNDNEDIMLQHEAAAVMLTITGTSEQAIGHIEVICAGNTYTLKCDVPVALSAEGKVFYVAVPGSETTLDYEVNIYSDKGTPMIKSFTKALQAGKIGRLPSLEYEPFHNLKYGDVYGGGIVFETKGKNVKVISLDAPATNDKKLKWATETSYSISTEEKALESGEEKGLKFRALAEDELAKYSAAEWCISKGEGWYLPSHGEYRNFNRNLEIDSDRETAKGNGTEQQNALNAKVEEYRGTAFTFGEYHWCCEESTENGKARYSRPCDATGNAGTGTGTKTTARYVRAVKVFTLQGGEVEDEIPEEPTIPEKPTLGDIYDGGLVFEVGNDYVKIISITQTKVAWSVNNATDVNVLNENLADGEEKCELFKALSNLSDYPAAEWCINKGEGWYLPSREEFKSIRSSLGINSTSAIAKGDGTDTQNAINEKLLNNGGDKFLFGEYFWTCDEKAAGKAIYARPCDNASEGGSKATERYVRAVKKITF